MASRKFRKKSVMAADRAHLHHRLLDIGLSYKATVRLIFVWALFLAAVAVTAYNAPDPYLMTFICISTILLYSILYCASRVLPWAITNRFKTTVINQSN